VGPGPRDGAESTVTVTCRGYRSHVLLVSVAALHQLHYLNKRGACRQRGTVDDTHLDYGDGRCTGPGDVQFLNLECYPWPPQNHISDRRTFLIRYASASSDL
jgi:hypothetical protein